MPTIEVDFLNGDSVIVTSGSEIGRIGKVAELRVVKKTALYLVMFEKKEYRRVLSREFNARHLSKVNG